MQWSCELLTNVKSVKVGLKKLELNRTVAIAIRIVWGRSIAMTSEIRRFESIVPLYMYVKVTLTTNSHKQDLSRSACGSLSICGSPSGFDTLSDQVTASRRCIWSARMNNSRMLMDRTTEQLVDACGWYGLTHSYYTPQVSKWGSVLVLIGTTCHRINHTGHNCCGDTKLPPYTNRRAGQVIIEE